MLSGLLKVGSIVDSLGVYLPSKIIQKAVGFARLLLFMYLMSRDQYGLWGLGMAVFTIAAPLLTLGSHHGLTRYASLYEARGQLKAFYRRMLWCVVLVTVPTTALALAGSDLITHLVIVSHRRAADITYTHQRLICWAALANAMVLALYYNMLAILSGLRTYRLAAVVELLFALAFAAVGIGILHVSASGLAVLLAHLAALVISLVFGMIVLHLGIDTLADQAPQRAETDAAGTVKGAFPRVLRFGLVALIGSTLWAWAGYVSFWLTNKTRGTAEGGVYHAFLSLGQPVVFVADAIWAVVFTHVARRWESHQRGTALAVLETAFKAVAMTMMTLTILLYAAAPALAWVLPARFLGGLDLLGGLLLFFQVMIHLALLTILAKLHERPLVIAVAALAAIAANVALAMLWMPARGAAGAALAAGVGVYAAYAMVTAVYVLLCRVRLAWNTWLVLAAPALLLLPVQVAAIAWAGVCAVTTMTHVMFSHREKQLLVSFDQRLYRMIRRRK